MAKKKLKTLPNQMEEPEKINAQDLEEVQPETIQDEEKLPEPVDNLEETELSGDLEETDTKEEEPIEDEGEIEGVLDEDQQAQIQKELEERNKKEEQEQKIKNTRESQLRMHQAMNLFIAAKNNRRKFDKEWLSRDLFRRGYQFITQNTQTGTVTMSSGGQVRIPVNLTWALMRAIKNQITSFKPKFEVMPEFKGKQAQQDARIAGKLLDYIFDKNNLTKKIKEAVTQGLIYSIGGPFEVYWDPYFDNGPNQPRGEVRVILHDPYDVYFDPDATEVSEANYIVKAVRTNLEQLKQNPLFDKAISEMIGGDGKQAESEYKQFLLQAIQEGGNLSDENETVILKEMQMKEYQEDGSVKIRFLTWVDELSTPLRDELRDQEDFDMEVFQADIEPLQMYGESWGRHVIAVNRVINALETSAYEYNYRMGKGRLVIDKNSGIKAITNEHGTIIEKNRGAEIRQLAIQSLPSTHENQIMRMRRYLEDISGVQDAMLGRTPANVNSGIGIAELKQSSASNQDDLVQNLEECLQRLGRKILKVAAEHYETPRIFRVVGTGRIVDHYAVVGEKFIQREKNTWKRGEDKYPLAHLATSNELKVQIGSWLAYSKEAQQKTIIDLAKSGAIASEDLLKFLEFPDVQDVVDRARAQSIIEQKRKEDPNMPVGVNQEYLALEENQMLAQGNPMPVDPEMDDHELHIAYHSLVLGQGENDRLVLDHINEHRRAMQGGGEKLPKALPQPTQIPTPQAPAPEMPPAIPTPEAPGMPVQALMSAGVQELPGSASAILGGASNSLPVANPTAV